jgi:hypothetical protein
MKEFKKLLEDIDDIYGNKGEWYIHVKVTDAEGTPFKGLNNTYPVPGDGAMYDKWQRILEILDPKDEQ